jgi:hypothetical protein
MEKKKVGFTTLEMKKAVGKCPYCGRLKDLWLNDVPLKAFCWGTEKKPHKEWKKTIPRPYNPYLKPYGRKE